jgi:hypothetical protein
MVIPAGFEGIGFADLGPAPWGRSDAWNIVQRRARGRGEGRADLRGTILHRIGMGLAHRLGAHVRRQPMLRNRLEQPALVTEADWTQAADDARIDASGIRAIARALAGQGV